MTPSNTVPLKDFEDITQEEWRQYDFPGGTVKLENPHKLYVTKAGHRVLTMDGISHYIPMGWLHLSWKSKDEDRPFIINT